MNLNVLRYIIEVERSRSITGAAKQLFISQPNLSRDIRELEEEIGFTVFTRSSRGVIPTEKGREFLVLAKKAVKQYQALENYCSRDEKDNISLHICVPRASYITGAFTAFLKNMPKGGSCRSIITKPGRWTPSARYPTAPHPWLSYAALTVMRKRFCPCLSCGSFPMKPYVNLS